MTAKHQTQGSEEQLCGMNPSSTVNPKLKVTFACTHGKHDRCSMVAVHSPGRPWCQCWCHKYKASFDR